MTMGFLQAPSLVLWPRGPARVDEGGQIVMEPRNVWNIKTVQPGELAVALGRVRAPSDAVAFVERYGLLECGPRATDFSEPFDIWRDSAADIVMIMEGVLTLRDAVGGDTAAMDHLRGIVAGALGESVPDRGVLEMRASQLAGLVNERLAGVSTAIAATDHIGLFAWHPQVPSLRRGVYYDLATMIVDEVPLEKCGHCGRLFMQTRLHRQWCSKECGNRARVKRWADKQRESSAPVDGSTLAP